MKLGNDAAGALHPQGGRQPLREVCLLGRGCLEGHVVGGVGGPSNDLVKGLQLGLLLIAISFSLPGKLQHGQISRQLLSRAAYQARRLS